MHNTIQRYSRLGGITLLGVIAVATIITAFGVNRIRVGGSLAEHAMQIEQFQAEMAPPPVYLLEPYLEASRMARYPGQLAEHRKEIAGLKAVWRERADFWEKSDLSPDLLDEMKKAVDEDGAPFFDEIEQRLDPAIARRDQAAIDASIRRLDVIYHRNRARIDALLEGAETQQVEVEDSAQTALIWTTILLALSILAITGGVVAAIVLLRRHVLSPLAETADTMGRMANGDLDARRRSVHADTEIGTMTRTIEVSSSSRW